MGIKLKALGILSGASMMVNPAKRVGSDITDSTDRIDTMLGRLWKHLRKPSATLPDLAAEIAADERFLTYLAHFGKSESDLPALRMQSAIAAGISALAGVGFAAYLIAMPSNAGMMVTVGTGAVPVAMLMLTIKHAYANWIFRRQQHGGFRAFLASGDWLPRR